MSSNSNSNSNSSSSKQLKGAAAGVRRWRPRQYVLTGMAAVVAASTVVIVTFVILRPALIRFSVTDAKVVEVVRNPSPGDEYNSTTSTLPGVKFNFTLGVYNPSRRAAVRYDDIVVNLQMDKKRIERRVVETRFVSVPTPFDQPAANLTVMTVQGYLEDELGTLYAGHSNATDVKMTITVMALVRFRVGLAFSRLYDIRIFCGPVYFFNTNYYNPNVTCSP